MYRIGEIIESGAYVAIIRRTVAVGVGVIIETGTGITDVAHAVTVAVGLQPKKRGAIVAGITVTIEIPVGLIFKLKCGYNNDHKYFLII